MHEAVDTARSKYAVKKWYGKKQGYPDRHINGADGATGLVTIK